MTRLMVAVRVRPLSDREIAAKSVSIVSVENGKTVAVTNIKVPEQNAGDSRERVRRFTFDYCFGSTSTQQDLYQNVGKEVAKAIKRRFHSCILAYGQSSSGKTHTMIGDADDAGLAPRLCQDIFDCLRETATGSEAENLNATVSYLEIYNEKVRDLLEPAGGLDQGISLKVREHPKKGPYVQGLSEKRILDTEELLSYLSVGNSNRTIASTNANRRSSRSHSVFTVTCTGGLKLRLVDLAGSERAGSRSHTTCRFREGANINKSLVALRNVISALADSSRPIRQSRKRFIPYRDSILTWLLKDTLGGNSKTILISTVSPSSTCYNETVNTLRFGQRAKQIIVQPLVNEDPKERTIRELRAEIAKLKELLALTHVPVFPKKECRAFLHNHPEQEWEEAEEFDSGINSSTSFTSFEDDTTSFASSSIPSSPEDEYPSLKQDFFKCSKEYSSNTDINKSNKENSEIKINTDDYKSCGEITKLESNTSITEYKNASGINSDFIETTEFIENCKENLNSTLNPDLFKNCKETTETNIFENADSLEVREPVLLENIKPKIFEEIAEKIGFQITSSFEKEPESPILLVTEPHVLFNKSVETNNFNNPQLFVNCFGVKKEEKHLQKHSELNNLIGIKNGTSNCQKSVVFVNCFGVKEEKVDDFQNAQLFNTSIVVKEESDLCKQIFFNDFIQVDKGDILEKPFLQNSKGIEGGINYRFNKATQINCEENRVFRFSAQLFEPGEVLRSNNSVTDCFGNFKQSAKIQHFSDCKTAGFNNIHKVQTKEHLINESCEKSGKEDLNCNSCKESGRQKLNRDVCEESEKEYLNRDVFEESEKEYLNRDNCEESEKEDLIREYSKREALNRNSCKQSERADLSRNSGKEPEKEDFSLDDSKRKYLNHNIGSGKESGRKILNPGSCEESGREVLKRDSYEELLKEYLNRDSSKESGKVETQIISSGNNGIFKSCVGFTKEEGKLLFATNNTISHNCEEIGRKETQALLILNNPKIESIKESGKEECNSNFESCKEIAKEKCETLLTNFKSCDLNILGKRNEIYHKKCEKIAEEKNESILPSNNNICRVNEETKAVEYYSLENRQQLGLKRRKPSGVRFSGFDCSETAQEELFDTFENTEFELKRRRLQTSREFLGKSESLNNFEEDATLRTKDVIYKKYEVLPNEDNNKLKFKKREVENETSNRYETIKEEIYSSDCTGVSEKEADLSLNISNSFLKECEKNTNEEIKVTQILNKSIFSNCEGKSNEETKVLLNFSNINLGFCNEKTNEEIKCALVSTTLKPSANIKENTILEITEEKNKTLNDLKKYPTKHSETPENSSTIQLIPLMEVTSDVTKPKPLRRTFSMDQKINSNPQLYSSTENLVRKNPSLRKRSVDKSTSSLLASKKPEGFLKSEVKSKIDSYRKPKSQIVAAVTSRLYSKVKKKEVATDTDDINFKILPKELSICSNARLRLQELSRKALRATRRKNADTQTELFPVLRVKEISTDVDDLRFVFDEVRDVEVETQAIDLIDSATNCSLSSEYKSGVTLTRTCGTSMDEDERVSLSFAKYFEDYLKPKYEILGAGSGNGNPIFTSAVNINVNHNYNIENLTENNNSVSEDSLDVEEAPVNMCFPDLISNHNSLEQNALEHPKIIKDLRYASLQVLPDEHSLSLTEEDFSVKSESFLPDVSFEANLMEGLDSISLETLYAAEVYLNENSADDDYDIFYKLPPLSCKPKITFDELNPPAKIHETIVLKSIMKQQELSSEDECSVLTDLPDSLNYYHEKKKVRFDEAASTNKSDGQMFEAMTNFMKEVTTLMTNLTKVASRIDNKTLQEESYDLEFTINDVKGLSLQKPKSKVRRKRDKVKSRSTRCVQSETQMNDDGNSRFVSSQDELRMQNNLHALLDEAQNNFVPEFDQFNQIDKKCQLQNPYLNESQNQFQANIDYSENISHQGGNNRQQSQNYLRPSNNYIQNQIIDDSCLASSSNLTDLHIQRSFRQNHSIHNNSLQNQSEVHNLNNSARFSQNQQFLPARSVQNHNTSSATYFIQNPPQFSNQTNFICTETQTQDIPEETLPANKYEILVENSCDRLEKLVQKIENSVSAAEELHKFPQPFSVNQDWVYNRNAMDDSSLESTQAFSDYGSLPRRRRTSCSPSGYLRQLTSMRRQIVESSREELLNEAQIHM